MFDLSKEKLQYKQFLQIHEAWNDYIKELIGNEKNLDMVFTKLLKADYHGAILKILKSKCKTYEGQSGIVIMETLRTFKLITEDNRVITILKKDSVFLVEVMGKDIKLFGANLIYRPSDRMKARFKARTLQILE